MKFAHMIQVSLDFNKTIPTFRFMSTHPAPASSSWLMAGHMHLNLASPSYGIRSLWEDFQGVSPHVREDLVSPAETLRNTRMDEVRA